MSFTKNRKENIEGILLIDKPVGITSFSVIHQLRKKLLIQKIGHAGTLDPFASGVLIVFVGRSYTKKVEQFILDDKSYLATCILGQETDTYDCDGKITNTSSFVPDRLQIEECLGRFQGLMQQIPPMYSAKKVGGKKLYELARKGKTIERKSNSICVKTSLVSYNYPELQILIDCSKGTYVRSLAHDIGEYLTCGAYVSQLRRLRSGAFTIDNCTKLDILLKDDDDCSSYFLRDAG